MAINGEQDQLKKQQGDQQTLGSGPAPTANSGRVASYSTGSPGASAPQGSGRFTNLKNYLGANQGAGEQLGSKITSNISKGVDKTEKQATTQAGQISQNINAEKERLNQGNTFNTQLQDQQTDGASAIYNDQGQRDQFGKLLTNQNVAGGLQTQAQTAADQASAGFNTAQGQINNLGTEQGRFSLLQQAVKQPGYTTGQQRLDQLFLQAGNPNQLVQNQRDLNKTLATKGTDLTNQFTDIGSQLGAVNTQADEMSKLLGGTLGTQTSNLTQAQIAEAQGLNTSNAANNATIEQFFKNGYGSLSPEQQQYVDSQMSGGLDKVTRTYNVLSDPNAYKNYTTQGSTNLTGKDVLDTNEFNRYQSLAGLAGTPAAQQMYTQAGAGATQAGIQGGKLQQDIASAKTALEQQLNRNATSSIKQGNIGGQFYNDITPGLSPIKADISASANFLDLLNQYGGNPANNGINVTGQYQSQMGALPGTPGFATNTNASYDAAQTQKYQQDAQQKLLQQYMDELNAAGYNNYLGGVKPV